MVRIGERVHSRYLFPSIVFLLVAQPVLASLFASESGLLSIPLAATLVACVWSLGGPAFWLRVAAGLGSAAVVTTAVDFLLPDRVWLFASAGCLAALGVVAIALGVRWLFGSPRVTVESLLAAMSVYLLMGLTFGVLYAAMQAHRADWFRGVSATGTAAEVAELVYFSLGTLTGTAFGDILPAHPIPRLLSNVEAVVGQMYVAVLVAMLVSGYAADRSAILATRSAPPASSDETRA